MTTKKSVVIDDVTWKAAKREAKKNGMLLSPFIVRAIRMALTPGEAAAKITSLNATIARMRGLIEGMEHEEDCAWQNCKGPKCNCVKSQVNL